MNNRSSGGNTVWYGPIVYQAGAVTRPSKLAQPRLPSTPSHGFTYCSCDSHCNRHFPPSVVPAAADAAKPSYLASVSSAKPSSAIASDTAPAPAAAPISAVAPFASTAAPTSRAPSGGGECWCCVWQGSWWRPGWAASRGMRRSLHRPAEASNQAPCLDKEAAALPAGVPGGANGYELRSRVRAV